METSPNVPDKIITQFKYNFKSSDIFDKIVKPEICDILVPTNDYRNPWFNDENRNKVLSENIKITSYGSGDNGSIVESKLDLSTIINTDIDAILKKYERLPDFNNSLNINV
jgi:hypothetical protein